MTDQYQTNHFKADNIRPFKPYRKRPACNDISIPIGMQGDNLFTKVRLYTYDATIDFPETSHFLSFANGKATTFCKVTEDDLRELVKLVSTWLVRNEELQPTYRAKEQVAEKSLNVYQVLSTNPDNGDNPLSPADIALMLGKQVPE